MRYNYLLLITIIFINTIKMTHSNVMNEINKALNYHKNGDFDNAIESYEEVLLLQELTPQIQATLRNNIGSLYMQQEKYDLAKEHLTKAVELMPESANAHYSLSILLTTKLNQHGKAIRHCHKAFTLDPNMHKAYHLMGNILQTMGKDEDAQRYFIQAETIAKNNNPEINENDINKNKGWESLTVATSKIGDEITTKLDNIDYTMICISERPLIFKISSLITFEECQHIMNRAKSKLEYSLIMGGSDHGSNNDIDNGINNDINNSYRSSHNAWLSHDEVLLRIQKLISSLSGIPKNYFLHKTEEMQVVKYNINEQFKIHHDSSKFHSRLLTALLYLNDVPEINGGETWFPFNGIRRDFNYDIEKAIELGLKKVNSGDTTGIKIKPNHGDAIIFFNLLPTGELDSSAVHAGLPVLQKKVEPNHYETNECLENVFNCSINNDNPIEKWVANYWVGYDKDMLNNFLNEL